MPTFDFIQEGAAEYRHAFRRRQVGKAIIAGIDAGTEDDFQSRQFRPVNNNLICLQFLRYLGKAFSRKTARCRTRIDDRKNFQDGLSSEKQRCISDNF